MADRPASSDGGADMALLGACRKGDLRRVEELWPRAKFLREMSKSISSPERNQTNSSITSKTCCMSPVQKDVPTWSNI